MQDLASILASRIAKNDTKGSFLCRSAAGCRRVCSANCCHSSLAFWTQHKMRSNSTSHRCKLCYVALLCNALPWVSAKQGLSCMIALQSVAGFGRCSESEPRLFSPALKGIEWKWHAMHFTAPAMVYCLTLAERLTCCLSAIGPICRVSSKRRKISIGFLKKSYNPTEMHCTYLTYLLALSESLPASRVFTYFSPKAHGHIDGWVALSNLHAIQCLVTQPSPASPAQIWLPVPSVARQWQVPITSQEYLQFNHVGWASSALWEVGRGKSVLLPALAAQGLSSRRSETLHIALTGSQNLREQCKILPQYSLHESMCSSVEDPKPRMTPKGVSCAEVQQGVEECAALIAATALLASEPQHKMLSNSTSHRCKLCCVALLCNALPWVSEKHSLSCMIGLQSAAGFGRPLFSPALKGIEWKWHATHFTASAMVCISAIGPICRVSLKRRKNSIGFLKKSYNPTEMHCTYLTYLLALSESLPASSVFAHFSPKAHGHIDGWLALSNLHAIQCLVTQPSPILPAPVRVL